ncbi:MAG: HAD family hydrolase [Myxococcales bacterium]|nr:HAD family hydrolase [Myxococcales bacterium]
MQPTVLLFDVDGTLVTTGGVGRRALERTFERLYGRLDACSSFRLDGMTDRAIVRKALEAIGREASEVAIDAILPVYVEVLEREVSEADMGRYRIHDGMREAVDASLRLGLAVGLGTGNIREGARVKLSRVGLFHRFAFGGFGCDSEDRAELLRIGAERGARKLGKATADCRVVVIGDTPKDVAAATTIGAECLGVGTGSFTAEQLLARGATHAYGDLSAPGALAALLGG